MKKIILFLTTFLSLFLLVCSPLTFSYWVWSPEAGKFVNPEEAVQDTAEEQYDYAMEFYKQKDLKETAKQLRALLKAFPGSRVAPDAQYRLGAVYEEMGDYHRAFRAYRDLLQRYPGSERMSEAVEREFRIGNLFLSGRRAKVMGLPILPSGPRAIEIFKHIIEAAPYSEFGDRSQFHLGLAYKRSNHFEEAIQAFQTLTERYPESKLVPQARFQLADTSYLQSIVASRDQRVIDRATDEIDRFLKYHPDSSVSDKAARLRQEIDERNADKNYRIGLFYEKENFLDSAFVYYRDVSERYSHTQGGKKAAQRLQALEKPAEFLKSQEAEITSKVAKLESQIRALGDSEEAQRKQLKEELKRLEKEEKEVQKSKPQTLKRRRAGLRQKEKELKEKQKTLERKKKRFAKNLSEDLARAFERWETSLEKEGAELAREKLRIEEWENSLGVSTAPLYAQLLPFRKEAPSPLEQVRRLELKRLEELAIERKKLFQEKEDLYHEYEKLLPAEGVAAENRDFDLQRKKLAGLERGMERLENTLQEKRVLYQKHFGSAGWEAIWQVPRTVVERSVGVLNPFEGSREKDWKSKPVEELKTLQSHGREKVEAQKILVDTIARAFDEELALAEEQRVFAKVEEEEIDPAAIRRAIKQLEREIRGRYSEIQDRNTRKSELLEELDRTLHRERKAGETGASAGGRILTAPVRGIYKFGRSFFFGLPERDVKLTREAKRLVAERPEAAEVQSLEKEIELESLLIDARNQEIQRLQRELDALQAQASLAGTRPFRSLLVTLPYVFVREAIASARRLVPKEDRKEKLIQQLNQETAELEQLKKELSEIEEFLEKEGKEEMAPEVLPAEAEALEKVPDPAQLEYRIHSIEKQLKFLKESYDDERERFEKTRWDKLASARGQARTTRLKEIEENLIRLIEKEQKIQLEERALLTKKREAVEQFLGELPPELFTKDLRLEQQEIESRLNQLQSRETNLGEELKRFRPHG